MGVCETIRGLLSAESHVNIGYFDDKYDNIVTVTPTGGMPPDHAFGAADPVVRYPTIQVRVRDKSFSAGFTRTETILKLLSGYSGVGYAIHATTDILSIGRDSNNRAEFTVNFKIILI